MQQTIEADRYDVVIAGARCAGASTALLLARAGLRVLVVDPAPRGGDTLSTHALMRGGVHQLHRWGLLNEIRASGAPPIRTTTFHYGDEAIRIPIKPSSGVDALYAPRRSELDRILSDAADVAGATVVRGCALVGLRRDDAGRVRGATIGRGGSPFVEVEADLVIGADGINSRVARLLSLEPLHTLPHASATVYGYARGLEQDGYHWYYVEGASIGLIPTNDGETCVFASLPPGELVRRKAEGLAAIHAAILRRVSVPLADRIEEGRKPLKYRGFAGRPGYLRPAAGPGWALVGDAGYFRDPITAHGITDAFRDAELLARAVLEGEAAITRYASERYGRVRAFFEVTDRIAAFEWTLDQVRADHLVLAREMKGLADTQADFGPAPARVA